jgi:hypothetical protein
MTKNKFRKIVTDARATNPGNPFSKNTLTCISCQTNKPVHCLKCDRFKWRAVRKAWFAQDLHCCRNLNVLQCRGNFGPGSNATKSRNWQPSRQEFPNSTSDFGKKILGTNVSWNAQSWNWSNKAFGSNITDFRDRKYMVRANRESGLDVVRLCAVESEKLSFRHVIFVDDGIHRNCLSCWHSAARHSTICHSQTFSSKETCAGVRRNERVCVPSRPLADMLRNESTVWSAPEHWDRHCNVNRMSYVWPLIESAMMRHSA